MKMNMIPQEKTGVRFTDDLPTVIEAWIASDRLDLKINTASHTINLIRCEAGKTVLIIVKSWSQIVVWRGHYTVKAGNQPQLQISFLHAIRENDVIDALEMIRRAIWGLWT